MNIAEVKSFVKKDLAKFLKRYDYNYDSKAYSFLRRNDKGFNGILTPIGDYSPLFKLGFSFTIRVNEVENIFNKFGRIALPFQQYSSTVIVQYDYFKEKEYFDYHFYNEDELTFVLKDFKEMFEQKVLPFLQRHSELSKLYDLVQSSQIAKVDSTAKPDNFIHWLIIANLCNAHNLELLAEDYFKNFFQTSEVEPDKKRVKDFLEYIAL